MSSAKIDRFAVFVVFMDEFHSLIVESDHPCEESIKIFEYN